MLSINLKRLQTLLDDKKIRLFTIILLTISILVIVRSINTITDNRSLAFQSNNLEAENSAQISGKYNIGNDESASGGKYIQLGVEGQSVTNTPSTIPTNTVNPTRIPTPTKKPTTVPTKSPTSVPTQKPSSGTRPYFGMAVDTSQISNYASHIKKYGVNIIAPANSMKMQTIGGCNGNYNFTKADQILNFAKQNNMQMHGHTLVWYSQTSSCATSFSKTQLKNYIQDVMKHYCGKLYSMDVVNEALADGGGYRTNNVWYRLYSGPGYIEDSFRWAREACPSMKLYYNDYSIETYGQAKTTSMLNLVRDLKAKNLLDGVGFQAHWTRTFDRSSWSRTMDEVSKMGLEFAISEMDVRFEKNYWDLTQNELNLQATTYRNAAELCRDKNACHHMIVWGVHDGDSWVNSFKGVADAALLFTRELRPKPAYCNGVKPVFNLPNGDCN